MKVGIVGASGWLGRHLVAALLERGTEVVGFSRGAREDQKMEWRQWRGGGAEMDLSGIGVVVNLAGESIDQRWTAARKERFRLSRVGFTEALVAEMERQRVGRLLNSSAVGIYGDRGDEELREDAGVGEGFLAELCRDWERAAEGFGGSGCCLRTGIVLGRGGGAWGRMEKIFCWGLGGALGSGRQWMPWIHLEDEVGAILHCLDQGLEGPVNLVAPGVVRNAEFTKVVGRVMGRPTILRAPEFALNLALGEFAKEGVLASQRVVPEVLEGYEFLYPGIEEAVGELNGGG